MGLDMYLSKESYIGANYEHREVKATIKITIEGVDVTINLNRLDTIIESVGYWRKANAIHKWFVDHCQDGDDDCRAAEVSRTQLQELLDTCVKVQANHSLASELLPPQSGFFFGGVEVDDWYFEQITDTIKILESVLSESECASAYPIYKYTSSW